MLLVSHHTGVGHEHFLRASPAWHPVWIYRCFDRILLNGLIQPFQQPERVVGFSGTYRNQYPVSRDLLRNMAEQFHNWIRAGSRALRMTTTWSGWARPEVGFDRVVPSGLRERPG